MRDGLELCSSYTKLFHIYQRTNLTVHLSSPSPSGSTNCARFEPSLEFFPVELLADKNELGAAGFAILPSSIWHTLK